MAWIDIDFNLIIPGMITRGPASVSFGEYLQQFSLALDEKQNMTQSGTPVLSEIPFLVDEIRNEGTFIANFRALIEGYRVIWFSDTWYEDGVLTDAENYPDYLITDADLEAAMGAEAWEILNDHATMSFQDIFKASILQGFYTIYLNTKVVDKAYIDTNDTPTQNRPTIKKTNGFFEYEASPDSVIGANGEAYSSVLTTILSGITEKSTTRQGPDDLYRFSYSAQRTIQGGTSFRWNVSYLLGSESADYMHITYLFKDLEDNILTMNAVPLFEITRNFISSNEEGEDTVFTQFDTDFPLIKNDLETVFFPIDPNSVSQSGGTVQEFFFNGNSGADIREPDVLADESSTSSFYAEDQQMIIQPPQDFIFIELNNPALEFFIL